MMMRALLLLGGLMMALMILSAEASTIEAATNVREVVMYAEGDGSVRYGRESGVAGVTVQEGPAQGDWSNMSLWFGLGGFPGNPGLPGFPVVTMDMLVIGRGSQIYRCNWTAGGLMELVPIPLVGDPIPPECLFQVQRDSATDNGYRIRVSNSAIGVQFWYAPDLSCHITVEGTLIGFLPSTTSSASSNTQKSNHHIPTKIRPILNMS